MARKSQEAIREEERLRAAEINAEVERRLTAALPDLVAKSTAAAMAQFAGQLADARAAAGDAAAPVNQGSDRVLLQGLAHAMAQAADPGNKRRILAPEVMQERKGARDAMMAMLLDNHVRGVVPVYKVIAKTFLAETMIDPQYQDVTTKKMVDQTINWPGVPNLAIVPDTASEPAKEVYALYLKSIGAKPVDQAALPAPWVTTGSGIRLGRSGQERMASEGSAMGFDPRRTNTPGRETKHILGTTAQPAVIGR